MQVRHSRFSCLGSYIGLTVRRAVAVLALLALVLLPSRGSAIVVDGDESDWAGISPLITDPVDQTSPAIDFTALRIANDATTVYFLWEFVTNSFPFFGDNFLRLDTDLNIATGCSEFGSEYILAFSFQLRSILPGDWLADDRKCGANLPEDVVPGLISAYGSDFIEASVPISALQILTPGLTGFIVTTQNDFSSPTLYQFQQSVPEPGTLALATLALFLAAALYRFRLSSEVSRRKAERATP